MSTVNEKMTAIADQIRTLIGATGTMGLDAMATNLTTANNAVASAKTAIANKDVSVSEDADINDLATLIESIMNPDVSVVTAAAGNVLAGKVFVDANGNAVTGTMTNRGAVSTTVEAGETYTIPKGYHNGSGKVTSAASTGHPLASGSKTLSSNATSISITHSLGVEPVGVIIMLNTTKSGASASAYVNYAYNQDASINLIASGNPYGGSGTWTLSTSTAKLTLDKITIMSSSVQPYFLAGTYLYVIWG